MSRVSHTLSWQSIKTRFLQFNTWANNQEALLIFLALNLLLRIPNLAEPYWYGDEAIYLTIGTALRNGAILYRDIVDHKTPIIYYLAMVPDQFWFRVLNIVWSLASTTFFYLLAKRWLNRWGTWLATGIFVLATCLPRWEGNIPNGELFVLGFLLAGMWWLARAGWWKTLENKKAPVAPGYQLWRFGAAGAVVGLALLTKVPAILDLGAIGSVVIFSFLLSLKSRKKSPFKNLQILLAHGLALTAGFVTPLLLSILYFWVRGAGTEYLEFGLLYNFHYTGTWSLPVQNPALLFLLSLPGKTMVLISSFLLALLLTWKFPKQALPAWTMFWLVAALFGALLSNRPYPHYLIQVVPPMALLVGWFIQTSTGWLTRGGILVTFFLFWGASELIGFGHYPTRQYYENAWKLLTGHTQPAEYRARFNGIVPQNETLVPYIQSVVPSGDPIFIWGTNPTLYAQAQRHPASRFTVAFHIHDLKNYDEVLQDVIAAEPKIIVEMKKESLWPELKTYMNQNYVPVLETSEMIIYHRSSAESGALPNNPSLHLFQN